MSKSLDVLAKEFVEEKFNGGVSPTTEEYCINCFKAGYKQRSDELIDLLVELEEYIEQRQDADYEGEERGMVPNKEMQIYSQLKDQIEKI